MASFLQNANPWIENTFTYASSFNPDTGEGFSGGGGTTAVGGTPNSDLYNSSQYYEQSQSYSEPQTNNTIPSGLLPSPDERGGGSKVVDNAANANNGGGDTIMSIQGVAPSRQSKIAKWFVVVVILSITSSNNSKVRGSPL